MKNINDIIQSNYKDAIEEQLMQPTIYSRWLASQPQVKVTRRQKIKRWTKRHWLWDYRVVHKNRVDQHYDL